MVVSVLLFMLFGLVVGLVARLLVGGVRSPVETIAVGVAGALIGGSIARALGWMPRPYSLPGLLVALLGAIVLILVARAVRSATE